MSGVNEKKQVKPWRSIYQRKGGKRYAGFGEA